MNKIETLKAIIKPYVPNPKQLENLTPETDFIKDLAINSANLVDIILDIEEKFDIVIDNDGMEKMMNVNAALAIIDEELAKKMIGNDIIDLQLAKVQCNWRRPNYLNKIFTVDEQDFITHSENPDLEVWKLWSRKEAAYKIYNRQTGIRGYFPWKIDCSIAKRGNDKELGLVSIENKLYYTETHIDRDFIYTIAATSLQLFDKIIAVNESEIIIKINGIPYIESGLKPVSITHHGCFERKITLLDS